MIASALTATAVTDLMFWKEQEGLRVFYENGSLILSDPKGHWFWKSNCDWIHQKVRASLEPHFHLSFDDHGDLRLVPKTHLILGRSRTEHLVLSVDDEGEVHSLEPLSPRY